MIGRIASMLRFKRDYYGGALMVLIGLIAMNDGRHYAIGTLHQMGPGYFPVVLGTILALLGLLIAGTASIGTDEEVAALPHNEWRGWACIIGGPVIFIILGEIAGMAPAIFGCVFVAAIGDRQTTIREALFLALGMAVFGVLLFSYVLSIPMPVLRWSLS